MATPRFGSHTSWKIDRSADLQAEQHACRETGHVAERRADQHRIACIEAEPPGERNVAGHQRIQAMHDAFGRAGRARGEHQHRHLIGGKRADLARRRRPEPLAAGQQRPIKAVSPLAVDDNQVLKFRQLGLQRTHHRLVIEATKQLGYDHQLCLGEVEHVAKLVFAEDRHQRIDDCADPEGRQRDHREFPPIGQLHGDDVTGADAKAPQGGGRACDEIAEFGIGEAPRLGAIGAVGQQREFFRCGRDRLLEKLVEIPVDPESAVAHRSRVGGRIEAILAHAFPP